MKKMLLLLLISTLVITSCEKDEGDENTPYIELVSVKQISGDPKVYADFQYGYIDCPTQPESGVVWSTSANPTILNTKQVFATQCYSQSGGNLIIENVPTNTKIYVRAYSLTKAQAMYSNEISYTTR